mmetsp:Transcript_20168/g.45873  ORF Transcript_20168/g.45873 Transcript_20168/m.45873 type:complete len:340 (-) Transcript_20168:236-1255(-)
MGYLGTLLRQVVARVEVIIRGASSRLLEELVDDLESLGLLLGLNTRRRMRCRCMREGFRIQLLLRIAESLLVHGGFLLELLLMLLLLLKPHLSQDTFDDGRRIQCHHSISIIDVIAPSSIMPSGNYSTSPKLGHMLDNLVFYFLLQPSISSSLQSIQPRLCGFLLHKPDPPADCSMLGYLEAPIDIPFAHLVSNKVPLAIETVLGDMAVIAPPKFLKLRSLQVIVIGLADAIDRVNCPVLAGVVRVVRPHVALISDHGRILLRHRGRLPLGNILDQRLHGRALHLAVMLFFHKLLILRQGQGGVVGLPVRTCPQPIRSSLLYLSGQHRLLLLLMLTLLD